MSSKELLLRFVRENLPSQKHKLEEFTQIATRHYRSKHESEPDEATVRDWYVKYQQQDNAALQLAEQRIENFLKESREAQFLELEKSQLAESFSLEDVINMLYHVDELLDKRLSYMNEFIEGNAMKLQEFNDLLELANSAE